jgi:HK97 family phage major capsid protein
MEKIAQIRAQRAAAYDGLKALAALDTLTADQETEFTKLETEIKGHDADIERKLAAHALAVKSAQPVNENPAPVPAQAKKAEKYETDRTLVVAGMAKMIGLARGSATDAMRSCKSLYGDSHPVTKALGEGSGPTGGFMVPPDYMPDVIELLRANAVVRKAGPRSLPMPHGTMTIPAQASAASATYTGENKPIAVSQPGVGQIVASAKKLTGLVPMSNELMHDASPAADAFVRDDLVQVLALREDLAFLLGDGTQETPRGMLSFANGYAVATGGAPGIFQTGGNSVLASGGNFIASNETYNLQTVVDELGAAAEALDAANVPDRKRVWFFHSRTKNYLQNVQNALGLYVFRDEMSKGTLNGYPFMVSNQIPVNLWDATGTNKDCSLVILAEMTEMLLLDTMMLELAVSQDGMYIDAGGVAQSAFQNDQTLIRAIERHDFQARHDASVAVIEFARWARSGS